MEYWTDGILPFTPLFVNMFMGRDKIPDPIFPGQNLLTNQEQKSLTKEQFFITWDKKNGTTINFVEQARKSHVAGTNFLNKGTIFHTKGTIFACI
jgi:hypothetical protein